ncbi:MAG: glycosyltransferase family 2 protein [Actinobacteria bacterium]|nr:glycosyltransferase family 2 protein [Actinomycetota bacterium]
MGDVAIVVVTYNSEDCITALLDSLADSGAAATVVVDNGSTDRTTSLVEGRPGVTLVRSTNVGYSGGINRGVREAPDADAYLILNPDLVAQPGLVTTLATGLSEPGVGVVVPLVLGSDGRRQDSLRREPSLLRALGLTWTGIPGLSEYVTGDGEYATPRDADWALGAAIMFSRACYEAVGGWDESYFLYSEETDFCLRARDAGWRTRLLPDAVVVHHEGGSGRSDATHVMQIVNRVRLYARRHSRPAGYAYLALNVLSELTWLARGQTQSRASVLGLLRPSTRPSELGCGQSLLPR